ncbi:MAG: methyl-accepting chemotaxis protein, partial [Campylobacteraceae bacterium]|nr:methyl-accepting chemotaxis protein [Campylobacteraceae bacterium]
MIDLNIKKINNYVIVFNFTFLIFIFILIQNINTDNTQIYEFENDRFKMIQTADKLRQSSDDLTHFARTYVITGDDLYKQQYFDTLDIRNGLKKRPKNYNTIYWDLPASQRKLNHSDTIKVSLKKLISFLPYSNNELSKLTLSEANSNDLVNLEVEAFNAMDGLYKNKEGSYAIKKAVNQKLAIKLMHSSDYYVAKHKIMKPIDDLMLELDKRTFIAIENLESG